MRRSGMTGKSAISGRARRAANRAITEISRRMRSRSTRLTAGACRNWVQNGRAASRPITVLGAPSHRA